METIQILAEINAEIERLEKVRTLLSGVPAKRGPGRPATSSIAAAPKKRHLSAEARERIAAAQRKRWAKVKKAAK
jgi:hypothetical protein